MYIKKIKNKIPETIKNILKPFYFKLKSIIENMKIKKQYYYHKYNLQKVKNKVKKQKKINIAFIVLNSSIWKYDELYKMMENDDRYNPIILICPFTRYGKKSMLNEIEKCYNMFLNKGFNTIKLYNTDEETYINVKDKFKPDIIFFTNPYSNKTKSKYYISNFPDILSCYTHYSFHVCNRNETMYNSLFNNLLWKAFYETEIHKEIAKKYSRNNAKNVVVSGYPGIDRLEYGKSIVLNKWKKQNFKKIIWAPHHSIQKNDELKYSNFLRYHKFMFDIAQKYEERIQIAFKPHPFLKNKLYNHNNWGRTRTDEYYRKWAQLSNGQLETDEYVELFNSSDAMIFDSASFTAEYLYCGKPSLFLYSDENVSDRFNEFGKLALKQHYTGYNKKDIKNFIEDVINEKDKKEKSRREFYNKYLIPPDGNKASKNIMNDLNNSIFGG
ncbi:CDP-glycerol--poly(glycerophosphate) glycerophosphotransferase [Halanaerobium hydrogeniformans]|uniref:CDP-glycerol:poly(Glycerophosphate) glycerophosphotransferase n=1 Tax=Halanaerobium hydrogeniformans TaxID=656519 RepID=E4RNK8_HALHG|nr:CDP-glycerol--poly(glycerophosphate) glycerophosphotransferase [Halanaerobium hydrogeniformans]ADQ13543.1 CDP-glycerol:poly(glycerophosphate) glycerophosphotransferase [Halanaerobium hydrogeniformans]